MLRAELASSSCLYTRLCQDLAGPGCLAMANLCITQMLKSHAGNLGVRVREVMARYKTRESYVSLIAISGCSLSKVEGTTEKASRMHPLAHLSSSLEVAHLGTLAVQDSPADPHNVGSNTLNFKCRNAVSSGTRKQRVLVPHPMRGQTHQRKLGRSRAAQ